MTPLEFLEQAIRTPSPSGYEEPIQKLISQYLQPHTDELSIDVHGNLTACVGPADAPRLMLAGHCDQIGMLISHIDEEGFLYAQTIGGWDPQQLIGQAMTIWTNNGPVSAVISRKPIHLLSTKERGEVVRLEDMWLDIGATSSEQAAQTVRIGDPVTLDLQYRPLLGDYVSGPGMDNKTGMWTVMEAVRRCATELDAKPLQCQLHSVATVQEEIGLRGARTAAARIEPDVAIAVDVTHASDCPTISKQQQGNIRLGGGPVIVRGPNVNAKVAARLIALAEEHEIPYQLAALGRAAPNDSNVLQISGAGVATGLVAVPNRYMHSAVETISTADIEAVAQLLALFAQSLTADCSFIPG
ncbi:M42 family metallopeptidase [Allorhodopirellula solitaria]|uniref:Putative aminopeptidase YsdC n=1 Tax=Allorhodopirellula solitaria TaxID=2527987 RepID=A0A5C5YBK0_9BACT|nr:M42 family metallopeptidase [Allorhodopirellula solitaria]TWT73076.1 putative aminopeptidase YsdC [Allorhodopirellula solitaria]